MVLKQPSAEPYGPFWNRIAGCSNPFARRAVSRALKAGSNYRVLKLDVRCAGLANWFEGINYRGVLKRMLYFAPRRFEGLEEDKLQRISNLRGVFAPERLWFGKDKVTGFSNGLKSQETQTRDKEDIRRRKVWKKIKLHGTQTRNR